MLEIIGGSSRKEKKTHQLKIVRINVVALSDMLNKTQLHTPPAGGFCGYGATIKCFNLKNLPLNSLLPMSSKQKREHGDTTAFPAL